MEKSKIEKIVKVVNGLADYWFNECTEKSLLCDIGSGNYWHFILSGKPLVAHTSYEVSFTEKEQKIIRFINEIKNEWGTEDVDILNVDLHREGKTIYIWSIDESFEYHIFTNDNGERFGQLRRNGEIVEFFNKDW